MIRTTAVLGATGHLFGVLPLSALILPALAVLMTIGVRKVIRDAQALKTA